MPPIRVHRPTPTLICSAGYSIWWPEGKEFQNDRYAECVKDEPAVGVSKSTPVDMKKRNNAHSNRAELKKSFAQVAKKLPLRVIAKEGEICLQASAEISEQSSPRA